MAHDPVKYPNLSVLDQKVFTFLTSPEAKLMCEDDKLETVCRLHPIYWMEQFGYIKVANVSSGEVKIEKFKLSEVQLKIADRLCAAFKTEPWGRTQAIILKFRKAGISTLCAAFDYWLMRTVANIGVFVIADLSGHTSNILSMIELFHEKDVAPGKFRKMTLPHGKRGLKLANGSLCECDTGENTQPGTSGTYQVWHSCVDPDTPVVVKNGFLKKASECVGQKIVTHNLRPAKIIGIHKSSETDGYEIKIRGNPVPIRVTKSHRLFAMEGRGGSWVEAERIATGSPTKFKHWFLGYPIRSFWKKCLTRRIEKGVMTRYRPQGGGRTHEEYSKYFPLTYGMGRVVGLYLAEGSIGKALKKYPSTINFACHKKEVTLFESWVKQAGLPCKIQMLSGQRANVVVRSSYWARIFRRWFAPRKQKQIPDWTWTTNEEYMKGIIHGYVAGDGHCSADGRTVTISSIRPQLLTQLREMMLTLGWGYSNLTRRDAGYWYGRNCKEIWTLSVCGKTAKPLRELLNVNYIDSGSNRRFWKIRTASKNRRIWLRIESIKPCKIDGAIDLEVDHPLHSFQLMGCASHNSESSKWRDPENAETSIINSIPRQGFAFMVKESTAFGMNKFAQDCENAQKPNSAWDFIFIDWKTLRDCEDLPTKDVVYTDEEKELATTYDLRPGHILFRRRQIDLLGSVEKFKQDFPLNPQEPFLVSGSLYFDVEKIKRRINVIRLYSAWRQQGSEVAKRMYPEVYQGLRLRFTDDTKINNHLADTCLVPQVCGFALSGENPSLVVSQDKEGSGRGLLYRRPMKTHKYIVSVDCAEGIETDEYTSDNSVVQVIDAFNREQVFEWAGCYDEEMTAKHAVWLAKIYNNAIIVPEINNKCGGLMIALLDKSGYSKVYSRQRVNNNTLTREVGFKTTSGNKSEVCGLLRYLFKNDECTIHSLSLLEEMLYFTDIKGKLTAPRGKTDDRIMSFAIGMKVIEDTPSYRSRDVSSSQRAVSDSQYQIAKEYQTEMSNVSSRSNLNQRYL